MMPKSNTGGFFMIFFSQEQYQSFTKVTADRRQGTFAMHDDGGVPILHRANACNRIPHLSHRLPHHLLSLHTTLVNGATLP